MRHPVRSQFKNDIAYQYAMVDYREEVVLSFHRLLNKYRDECVFKTPEDNVGHIPHSIQLDIPYDVNNENWEEEQLHPAFKKIGLVMVDGDLYPTEIITVKHPTKMLIYIKYERRRKK